MAVRIPGVPRAAQKHPEGRVTVADPAWPLRTRMCETKPILQLLGLEMGVGVENKANWQGRYGGLPVEAGWQKLRPSSIMPRQESYRRIRNG